MNSPRKAKPHIKKTKFKSVHNKTVFRSHTNYSNNRAQFFHAASASHRIRRHQLADPLAPGSKEK